MPRPSAYGQVRCLQKCPAPLAVDQAFEMQGPDVGVSENKGHLPLWGPCNKDPTT